MLRQLAYALPQIPGFDSLRPKTYAAWPVWSGSTTDQIQWPKVVKKALIDYYHQLRRWNALKQIAGRYGGDIGSSALRIAECLIFDFQNWQTGQLDPGWKAIATKTGLGRTTVWEGLRRLRELGFLHWLQRAAHHWQDGKFQLKQITNAYVILPPSQWKGFKARPEAPPPDPGTWGDHPPLPDAVEQALDDRKHGASVESAIFVLEQDDTDPVAKAWARLFRSVVAREKDGRT